MNRLVFALSLLFLSACTEPPVSDTKAIIGATLVNASRSPLPYSIVVIKDDRIVAVGPQQVVPVPAGSAKIEAYGKFLKLDSGEDIEVGAKANLVLLAGPPESNPKVERRMTDGRWVE